MAAGASEFVATPAFIRDIVNGCKLALIGRAATDRPAGQPARPPRRGCRTSAAVYYILRALAAMGASALLRLERGNRRAELRVSDGRLLSASVDALQSLPALHHTLLWEQASLSIKLGPAGKRNQLNLTTQQVLDEGERFLRDFAHAARELGPSSIVYLTAPAGAATPGLQTAQAAPLLRLCDGHRTLADVISDSPFRIFDTLRMIKRLRDSGALISGEPPPPQVEGANGRAGSMLGEWAMVPDLRGVVGDRRHPNRQLRPMATVSAQLVRKPSGPVPVLGRGAPAPTRDRAPKQPSSPAGSGPLPAPNYLSLAPTVQVKVGPDGTPLAAPAPMVAAVSDTPPPVIGTGPSAQRTPIPLVTRADRDAQASMEVTPPPEVRSPAAPPQRLDGPQTGPRPVLGRPTTGPQPRLNGPYTGSHPVFGRPPTGPQPTLNRTPTGPQSILNRPPTTGAQRPLQRGPTGPQPRLDRQPPARGGKLPSGPQARLDRGSAALRETPAAGTPMSRKTPVPAAVPLTRKTPVPIGRPVSRKTPVPRATPVPRGKAPSSPQLPTLANAFDDVEADFFAREADLYKRDAVETFDDLENPLGGASNGKPRPRKR